jgi:MraZ protein
MALFLSTYHNKLDRKGRISVPAAFRTILSEQSFVGVVAYPSFIHPCIEACSMRHMERLSASIDALDPYSPERDAFASAILGAATPLAFDGEGRVMLPEALLAVVGHAEQLVFVGKGTLFEMWEPEAHRAHAAAARALATEKRGALRLMGGTHG